jgi:hypothetical protein
MEAHLEGLDQRTGARAAAAARQDCAAACSTCIEVAARAQHALEAALGPYVQALVVDTRAHAARDPCGELVSSAARPRALLVEEEFGPTSWTRAPFDPPAGVASAVSDLVRHCRGVDSARPPAARLAAARRRARRRPQQAPTARARDLCFVTPDGTLCAARASRAAPAAEGHAGPVVRRSQIQELRPSRPRCSRTLLELQAGKEPRCPAASTVEARAADAGRGAGRTAARLQEGEGQLRRSTRAPATCARAPGTRARAGRSSQCAGGRRCACWALLSRRAPACAAAKQAAAGRGQALGSALDAARPS